VELIAHNFFGHVFPQITKFFAFFKNTKLRKTLVDKLFTLIDTDPALKAEFKKYLAHTEVYKFLSDIVESSQNILLIADGQFHELAEIIETYTDTWGKMVKRLEIRKFVNGPETVYSINPDFDTLEYLEAEATGEEGENGGGASTDGFTESFHLDDTSAVVRDVYARVKKTAKTIDARFTFNPQKYYISIKAKKNIAFIKFRKKKIRFVVLLPESDIRAIISKHDVVPLSEPVQDFYNGQCAAIDIPDVSNFGEIEALLKEMAKRATWAD
jgi:predicted transport protein